jgi:serine/threonine-protein kinase
MVVTDPPLTQPTDAAPPNTVLKQDPPAGTQVPKGSTITLTVAKPIPKVKVPDISSGCLTVSAAQVALQAQGLDIGNKAQTTSDKCQTGEVIAQGTPPGKQVPKGTLIDVTIVSGPSSVAIGDYTCLTLGKASSDLRKAQLNPVFGGTAPVLPQCPNPNFVAAQDPAPGTSVPIGGTVTLYTGEEASPTTSPSSSGSPSP